MSINRPDLQAEQERIVHNVFRPGDLVWGTTARDLNQLRSIIEKGIITPSISGQDTWGFTPLTLCFALLSRDEDNYNFAVHSGPKPNLENPYAYQISVIVDKNMLISRFPSQVTAVGQYFQEKYAAED